MDQEDETQGERHQPGETKYKADHGACPFYALEKCASSRYRLARSPSPFNYSRFGQTIAVDEPLPTPA
jgi:hypothetical protein